jgi:hypothetical protein
MMNGQWIGEYTGTNRGLLVVDLDDVGAHYDGTAVALDGNLALPPMVAVLLNLPKGQQQFQLRAPLTPIDRINGRAVTWDEIKKNYSSDVTVPSHADISWDVGTGSSEVTWTTNIGTSGRATVAKSRSADPSELTPLADVKSWEDFRRFARELPPYQYIFRGQPTSKRLRTSFHRTGRTSLFRYELNDIPALHRHLSGMMVHHLDLRDALQNAAFYNLIQHHGYPTPLLDWTYSPFIGAFFAYRGVGSANTATNERVRIFVFDKLNWSRDFEPQYLVTPAKIHFTLLEPLALNNPRVVPQQSVSSLTNIDDIETYLKNRETVAGKQYLRVIDLPSSERHLVMHELRLMGITAGSLFPGIDGACEEIKGRFFGL